MAEKKYYWLKLKNDFFSSREMKKLRRIAGGDTYTIIYLKLQLLSLQSDGRLYFDGIEDTFAEELALTIDEDADNVQATLVFLQKCKLAELVSESEMLLTEVPSMIGGECDSAARVRKFREAKKAEALPCNGKALQCNNVVTECNEHDAQRNTDIEIEIDKEIETETEREKEKDTEIEREVLPFRPSSPQSRARGDARKEDGGKEGGRGGGNGKNARSPVIVKIEQGIKERIEYSALVANNAADKPIIDGIVGILLEAEVCGQGNVVISGIPYPADFVRQRLGSLGYEHVDFVLAGYKDNIGAVRDARRYLLTLLFNAPLALSADVEKFAYGLCQARA